MSNYSEMIRQIEALKIEAEKTRKEELTGIIKAIKKQIADYGITAEQLGLNSEGRPGKGLRAKSDKNSLGKPRAKRKSVGAKVAPKYRDESGNTWTGRGKKPGWVVNALAMGRELDSLLIR